MRSKQIVRHFPYGSPIDDEEQIILLEEQMTELMFNYILLNNQKQALLEKLAKRKGDAN